MESQRKGTHAYLTPMIWAKDPDGHLPRNCYACHNFKVAISRKKVKIYESTLTGAIPVAYNPAFAAPNPPSIESLSEVTDASASVSISESAAELLDPSYVDESEGEEPDFLSQEDMDFLVAKGRMSKKDAEFTASFLKKKKLTDHVIATSYRNRQKVYEPFFTKVEHPHEPYAYCNNIPGLFLAMEMEYIADDWRIFIDGSSASLKGVLLHKTNLKPTVPVYYATGKKESRESLEELLNVIDYDNHDWKLCGDLKVISLLCGAKGGNAIGTLMIKSTINTPMRGIQSQIQR